MLAQGRGRWAVSQKRKIIPTFVSCEVNRIPESRTFLFGESGIGNFFGRIWNPGLWNPEYSSGSSEFRQRLESVIQVPLTRNPESSTWNPEFTAWNQESKTVSDQVTWTHRKDQGWARKTKPNRVRLFKPTQHFDIAHNTLCLPPKVLHSHCFQFFLGITVIPRKCKIFRGKGGVLWEM